MQSSTQQQDRPHIIIVYLFMLMRDIAGHSYRPDQRREVRSGVEQSFQAGGDLADTAKADVAVEKLSGGLMPGAGDEAEGALGGHGSEPGSLEGRVEGAGQEGRRDRAFEDEQHDFGWQVGDGARSRTRGQQPRSVEEFVEGLS